MNIRAKMYIESITKTASAEELKLHAVYGGDKNSEDNTFSKATPAATLIMQVTNEALHGQFKPGQRFYVDFSPAE